MRKSHACYPSSAPASSSSSSSSMLGMATNSHTISKLKPRIRIIHVYAPEIIKTDAANFRELVQRLTGKPEDEEGGGRRKKKTQPTIDPLMDFHPKKRMIMEHEEEEGQQQQLEFLGLQNGIKMIKKEDRGEEEEDNEIWGRSISNEKFSGGFFEGFSELDGFMEELSTMPLV